MILRNWGPVFIDSKIKTPEDNEEDTLALHEGQVLVFENNLFPLSRSILGLLLCFFLTPLLPVTYKFRKPIFFLPKTALKSYLMIFKFIFWFPEMIGRVFDFVCSFFLEILDK